MKRVFYSWTTNSKWSIGLGKYITVSIYFIVRYITFLSLLKYIGKEMFAFVVIAISYWFENSMFLFFKGIFVFNNNNNNFLIYQTVP